MTLTQLTALEEALPVIAENQRGDNPVKMECNLYNGDIAEWIQELLKAAPALISAARKHLTDYARWRASLPSEARYVAQDSENFDSDWYWFAEEPAMMEKTGNWDNKGESAWGSCSPPPGTPDDLDWKESLIKLTENE